MGTKPIPLDAEQRVYHAGRLRKLARNILAVAEGMEGNNPDLMWESLTNAAAGNEISACMHDMKAAMNKATAHELLAPEADQTAAALKVVIGSDPLGAVDAIVDDMKQSVPMDAAEEQRMRSFIGQMLEEALRERDAEQ